MNIEEAISQLESLKLDRQSFLEDDISHDEIYLKDIRAINRVVQELNTTIRFEINTPVEVEESIINTIILGFQEYFENKENYYDEDSIKNNNLLLTKIQHQLEDLKIKNEED